MVYQVTVHDEVVAEIKTSPRVKPGEAAKQLLALRKRTVKKVKQRNILFQKILKRISTQPRTSREFSSEQGFLRHVILLLLHSIPETQTMTGQAIFSRSVMSSQSRCIPRGISSARPSPFFDTGKL